MKHPIGGSNTSQAHSRAEQIRKKQQPAPGDYIRILNRWHHPNHIDAIVIREATDDDRHRLITTQSPELHQHSHANLRYWLVLEGGTYFSVWGFWDYDTSLSYAD